LKKILAFDIGTKRIGIAATDDYQLLASPLDVVSPNQVFEYIFNYLQKNNVECFIVGLPVDLKGKPSHAYNAAFQFSKTLNKKFKNIPVVTVDERFTSKIAEQELQRMGYTTTKKDSKSKIDALSAVILLEEYLKNKRTSIP
jgi:putative Holliday junction resolvase